MPKHDPARMHHDDPLADILESCVAEIQDQGRLIEECLDLFPAERGELEPLLRLAVRLHDVGRVAVPSVEFRQHAEIRIQNLLAASPRVPGGTERPLRRPAAGSLPVPWPAPRPVAVAIMVLLLAVLVGSIGVVVSAQALPGNLLYPLKTAVEEVRLAATTDPLTELTLHLELAQRRLEEAAALQPGQQTGGIATALRGYRRQLERALAILQNLDGFRVEDQRQLATELEDRLEGFQRRLGDLEGSTPGQDRAMVSEALHSFEAAQEIVQRLRAGEPPHPSPPPSAGPERPHTLVPSPLKTPTTTLSPAATAAGSPTAIVGTALPRPTIVRPRATITELPAVDPDEQPPVRPPVARTRMPTRLPQPGPAQTRPWPGQPAITPPQSTATVPTVGVPTVVVPTVQVPTVEVPTVEVPTVNVPTITLPDTPHFIPPVPPRRP